MPRTEDRLEQLARIARDDEALHAASERRPAAQSTTDEAPTSTLPESLTQPISDAQRSSVVDAIQARLARGDRVFTPTRLESAARRRQRRTGLVAVVACTALVAAVLLALRLHPDVDGPLSRYEVRVQGAEQAERGSAPTSGPLRIRPGSKLDFDLRPRTDERGSVRVRAFVQGLAGSAETSELSVAQEQSAAGALRVTARVPRELPERGELLLYVGRPGAIERVPSKNGLGDAPGPGNAQEFQWQFQRSPE